jgi:hypothetical protein
MLLAGMIDAKTRLHSQVVKTVTVGDIAQLYTDFEGTTVDDSGKTVAIRHEAIEVLRRRRRGLETDRGRPRWTRIRSGPRAKRDEINTNE